MSDALIGYGAILRVWYDGAWQAIAELNSIGGPSGGTVDKHEVSHYQSANRTKEYITGLKDTDSLSFSGNFLPSDVSQQMLYSMRENGTVSDWEVVLNDAESIDNRTKFAGPGAVMDVDFDLPVNAPMTISGTIDFVGAVTMTSVSSDPLTALVVTGSASGALTAVPELSLEDTFDYVYVAAYADESVTVTPTKASATITVNGVTVASGQASIAISLDVGVNKITVRTKDADKPPLHYGLFVVRENEIL